MSKLFWALKSTRQILIDHMGINPPSFELIKLIDSFLDICTVSLEKNDTINLWYFIHGFTEKEIMFIFNNFSIDFDQKLTYFEFFSKTKGMTNQKEIALKYKEVKDLDIAIDLCKKETFDLALLDFLADKMTEEKMINWGVGQIMKLYPGKYSAKEINEAIRVRFFK
jgi:hypothetical protein